MSVSPSVAELVEQLAQAVAVNTRLREVIQAQGTQLEAQAAQLHTKDALVGYWCVMGMPATGI